MPIRVTVPQALLDVPSRSSSSDHWKQWHMNLRRQFGRKNANALFIMAWERRNPGGTLIFGSNASKDLREYLAQNKIKIEAGGLQILTDAADDTLDFMERGLNMSWWLIVIAVVIVIGTSGLLLYNLASKPETAIDAAKLVATRGLVKDAGGDVPAPATTALAANATKTADAVVAEAAAQTAKATEAVKAAEVAVEPPAPVDVDAAIDNVMAKNKGGAAAVTAATPEVKAPTANAKIKSKGKVKAKA